LISVIFLPTPRTYKPGLGRKSRERGGRVRVPLLAVADFGDEVKDHCDKTLAGSAFRHLDLPELCEIVQFN
jgi:hypothetical protein